MGKKVITERHLFGLESMRDKMCAKLIDSDTSDPHYAEYFNLRDECQELIDKLMSKRLTSAEYERVVEITLTREQMRFDACMAAGMSYEEAAPALRGE